MNVKSLLVAASIAVATSNAFAADPSAASSQIAAQPASPSMIADASDDPNFSPPSTLTRAQVHSEVLAARAAGTLPGPGDDVDYPGFERREPTGRFDAAEHPYLTRVGHWFKSLHASTPVVGSN
jgi:hypothetical protein